MYTPERDNKLKTENPDEKGKNRYKFEHKI